MSRRSPEGVQLALLRGFFAAAAEEMGSTLMRAAHSPNITERLDHSCAVFDSRARLVAQAAHIPVHLGSMPRAVEAALALAPFRPGDVVLLNDPFAGGTHLPDLTLVSPVFLGRERTPSFFVASRAHHADVGGAAPGSLPLAREIYEEGLRIPPVFLRRAGATDEGLLGLILANVRTPEERRADLAAQVASQRAGELRIMDLAKRLGAAALRSGATALQAATERQARAALARLPKGRWSAEDLLDDDGLGTRDIRIACTLTLGGGRCRIDFTESSTQVAGPLNAVRAVTTAASLYAVRLVLAEDIAIDDGLIRSIEVVTRPGSVVDPLPPSAVGGGNVETSQRLVDTVLRAFAKALPGRMPAASSGTMNNLLIGGVDPRTGLPFAYYETLGGGHGASPDRDGASAMQVHMTNTRNTPIESLEHAYPLRVERYAVRRGSGGAGLQRGGDGIERAIALLSPARVTVIAERRTRGPWGLAGGDDGAPGETLVRSGRTGGAARKLSPKFTLDLAEGTVLTLRSPGGGGWGRPRNRQRRAKTRKPTTGGR